MRFCINRPSFMIFTNWQILQRPANKRDCQQLVRPWSYRTQPRLECQSQNHPGHVTALHMSMYPQVCVYLHYRYIRLDLYTHAYIQSYLYVNVCISRVGHKNIHFIRYRWNSECMYTPFEFVWPRLRRDFGKFFTCLINTWLASDQLILWPRGKQYQRRTSREHAGHPKVRISQSVYLRVLQTIYKRV